MLADHRPQPPAAPAYDAEEEVINGNGGQQRIQKPKVVIITDSSHALDQIQRFLQGQPLRIRPTNSLIMDALTSVLLRLLFMDSVRLEFRKVKSHAGVEGNCRADGLARAAARAMAMAMPTPWDGDGLGGSWCGFTMVSVDDYLCLRGGQGGSSGSGSGNGSAAEGVVQSKPKQVFQELPREPPRPMKVSLSKEKARANQKIGIDRLMFQLERKGGIRPAGEAIIIPVVDA